MAEFAIHSLDILLGWVFSLGMFQPCIIPVVLGLALRKLYDNKKTNSRANIRLKHELGFYEDKEYKRGTK